MKKVLLFLCAAFITSCAHLFMGVAATQHSSIRFMVRDGLLMKPEDSQWSRHLQERFVRAEELQDCSPKIQEQYREAIHDARNAIAAGRRANILLTSVCGCFLLGAASWVVVERLRKKSNKPSHHTA